MDNHLDERKNKPCPGCGGSGQTSYFGGESRFMMTWEDCPDCSGTGIDMTDEHEKNTSKSTKGGEK